MASINNIQDLRTLLTAAHQNGTLLTPKHNPNSLQITYSTFRSVIAHDLADNLENFLISDEYTATLYDHTLYPNSPFYCVLDPSPSSKFNVPVSGVTSNAISASTILDRLVIVSGNTSGLHIYGENESVIEQKRNDSELINQRVLPQQRTCFPEITYFCLWIKMH